MQISFGFVLLETCICLPDSAVVTKRGRCGRDVVQSKTRKRLKNQWWHAKRRVCGDQIPINNCRRHAGETCYEISVRLRVDAFKIRPTTRVNKNLSDLSLNESVYETNYVIMFYCRDSYFFFLIFETKTNRKRKASSLKTFALSRI